MTVRKEGKKKEDLHNVREEIIHQFHIFSEGVISKIKQVAEGVVNFNERLDRTREELKAEIDNKTQLIAQAVVNLGERLDKTRQELKAEIQESRQEVLAAIKFSYSELDKCLTTLEKEFLELKLRVEKIESRSIS